MHCINTIHSFSYLNIKLNYQLMESVIFVKMGIYAKEVDILGA